MKNYKAIIFDLFGTLIHFDETRLPALNFQGQEIHSTTPPLFEIASKIRNGYTLESFHQSLREVSKRQRQEKTARLMEISCLTRMKALLSDLNFPETEQTNQLAKLMKNVHMGWLKKGVYLPEGHFDLLEKLKPSFQLGLLSNFDDARTGYRILEELHIDTFFHSTLFSEEAGWIKPHPSLFDTMLTRMNLQPYQVLFVGDTPDADVMGPKQFGMDTVWINSGSSSFPDTQYRPDFQVTRLSELEAVITHLSTP
ncbi:MAG: HAD family hydrolase [Nitrospiria bacterium]